MRDINRIDEFCSKIARQWKRVPDFRFGQLMYAFFQWLEVKPHKDARDFEENEFLKYFEDFVDTRTDTKLEYGWIPVTQQGTPCRAGTYLCSLNDGSVRFIFCKWNVIHNNFEWIIPAEVFKDFNKKYAPVEITAWMPEIKPYKGE